MHFVVELTPEDQLQPDVRSQLYPKPGDRIDLEQPVLFDVGSGKKVSIANDLFPNPYQLTDLHWRADSRTFAFEYTRRGHQQARIIEVDVDADTGAARAVITENSDTFIWQARGYWHDVHNLGDGLIWLSERDGWAHLYLVDGRTGLVKNRITTGDWPVHEVLRVDDDKRQIWFAATGMNANEDPTTFTTFATLRLRDAPRRAQVLAACVSSLHGRHWTNGQPCCPNMACDPAGWLVKRPSIDVAVGWVITNCRVAIVADPRSMEDEDE